VLRIRIRIRSDPDLFGRIRIRILALINNPISTFFMCCKSHKYFRFTCCLTFWFMNILFNAYFGPKKILKKFVRKFIKVRIQIRIRNRIPNRIRNRIRIQTFSKVGSGSGQKSSGSATRLISNIIFSLSPSFYHLHLNSGTLMKQRLLDYLKHLKENGS
jgi:hypothetical protein